MQEKILAALLVITTLLSSNGCESHRRPSRELDDLKPPWRLRFHPYPELLPEGEGKNVTFKPGFLRLSMADADVNQVAHLIGRVPELVSYQIIKMDVCNNSEMLLCVWLYGA